MRRIRYRRLLAWLSLIVLLALLLVVGFTPISMRSVPSSSCVKIPSPNYTISEETTVLTEPRRRDGSVMYMAAVNRTYGDGVTPDNNAVVVLLQAFGLESLGPANGDRYFELLGIVPQVSEESQFVPFDKFANQYEEKHLEEYLEAEKGEGDQEFVEIPRTSPLGESRYVATRNDQKMLHPRLRIAQAFERTRNRPWTNDEFSEISKWLDQNGKALDLVVQASQRPRYFAPMLADGGPHGEEGALIGALLSVTGSTSEAASALQARAMLRLFQGDVSGSWTDLLTCHRLARLVGQDPTLVGLKVSTEIETATLAVTAHLISAESYTAERAAQSLADLRSLAPVPDMIQRLDTCERYMLLDTVCWFSAEQQMPGYSSNPIGKLNDLAKRSLFNALIDWDVPLKRANEWFDELVSIAEKPTYAERAAALEEFEMAIKTIADNLPNAPSLMGSLLSGRSARNSVSHYVGERISAFMLPAVAQAHEAHTHARAVARLNLLAAALAAYRANHGQWPERLDMLTSEYLDELPVDPFTDAPFRYERRENGFLLYSLGLNIEDDSDMNLDPDLDESAPEELHPECDDIRIQVPPQ